MTQKYWITTQWPPDEHDEDDDFDVELQYNHLDAGQYLEHDDLILIYQLKTGPVVKGSGKKREVGKRGIIALVKADGGFARNDNEHCKIFTDGEEDRPMYWKWISKTKLVSRGFVSRGEVNEILDFSPNYNFRGFGKNRSGLRQLTPDEFCSILRILYLFSSYTIPV